MSEPYCSAHQAVEMRLDRDDKRLDGHSEKLDSVEACTIKLTSLIEQHQRSIDDLTPRVSALEQRPIKWVDQTILVAISLVVGFIARNVIG